MKYLSCLFLIICLLTGKAQPVSYPYITSADQTFKRIFPDNNEQAMNGNRWSPMAVFKSDIHSLYGDNNGIYY